MKKKKTCNEVKQKYGLKGVCKLYQLKCWVYLVNGKLQTRIYSVHESDFL